MSHEMSDSIACPARRIATDTPGDSAREGIGLCLSGGGYRAMLFHLGTLWRLNELAYLKKLDRISSVSGGSITAGVLGLNWGELAFDAHGVATAFVDQVVAPVRRLAGKTLDRGAVVSGTALPGVTINDRLVAGYRKYLFGNATLQALPDDPPRFVINATNLQSGALWRFMKPYMRDWRVGMVERPNVLLAQAVAASSAFPPVLSPANLKLKPSDFTPGSGSGLQKKPYTRKVVLADGGVYDNLGLETVWKCYRTVLVSDAGGQMPFQPRPKHQWLGQTARVLGVIDNQVRSLRKRQVVGSFERNDRDGAYWSIRTKIGNFGLDDALHCPVERTHELAETPTRLKKLGAKRQERLINWGYAACDAALRAHVDAELAPPADFPYPQSGV